MAVRLFCSWPWLQELELGLRDQGAGIVPGKTPSTTAGWFCCNYQSTAFWHCNMGKLHLAFIGGKVWKTRLQGVTGALQNFLLYIDIYVFMYVCMYVQYIYI